MNLKLETNATETVRGKWCGLRNWTLAATLSALVLTAGMVRAQVTNVIYQDNFARVGPLDGSAPDTVNTPGATWFACNVPWLNAQMQTDGASMALTNVPGTTNGLYLNGFLPFPTGGSYLLS